MGAAVWVVIVAIVVIGIVVAVFGWDRYRSNPKGVSEASQPTDEVFTDPARVRRCACGTTLRPASGSTAGIRSDAPLTKIRLMGRLRRVRRGLSESFHPNGRIDPRLFG